ncbi:hypothetical protein LCGC14_1908300 [marine sediment metagenome]|uniref:Uncharacterized protein n=1 Tax=marine sediment metagenome TaxID=412755 RepID=A0A0F9ISE7_9ZZZZ
MTEICKCGHEKSYHKIGHERGECIVDKCKCKKFEAEEGLRVLDGTPTAISKLIRENEKQKGCGKGYRYFNGANWQKNYCGIDGLCPKCKPQNHSPSMVQKDTPENEREFKDFNDSSGTNSQHSLSKTTDADTFNLSRKRKALYDEMKLVCSTLDEEQLLDTVFLWLNKQDKEFIKRVLEIHKIKHITAGDIKELAGKGLL